MPTTPAQATDALRPLLAAARQGDEDAYRRLLEPHRAELHAHCYRMLGSVHDAEDALQEASLRAWRGLSRFEERSSLRSWLFRIATNVCLNAIERRPPRLLPVSYGPAADPHDEDEPLVESIWIEPYPDAQLSLEQRESVELAFVAALQLLPARQRAALIMRDVLAFSAREVAEALDTSVASVNSSLQRARKGIAEHVPERSQQATLRELGADDVRALVQRYADAMERADIDTVVAMLTEDAIWSMPPYASWYRGRAAITVFLRENALNGQLWRHVPTTANGQPAVGCYMLDSERGRYLPGVVDVLTLDGGRIAAVTGFVTPEIFPSFGLPPEPPRH